MTVEIEKNTNWLNDTIFFPHWYLRLSPSGSCGHLIVENSASMSGDWFGDSVLFLDPNTGCMEQTREWK